MNFSNDYFEDEVRDGFYVASVIKRIWAAQLEVLEDIDKVCKKHHITTCRISLLWSNNGSIFYKYKSR